MEENLLLNAAGNGTFFDVMWHHCPCATAHSAEERSKVLIVMHEMGLIPLVHLLASFLHVLGQARWSTAEYTDFTNLKRRREDS